MAVSPECKSFCSKFGSILFAYYLPIGLLVVVVIGALFPPPGVFFNDIQFKYVSVPIIFLISGLKLKTDEIRDAFKAWRALIWGLLSILLVTPTVGILLTNLLPFNVVEPGNYSVGGNDSTGNGTDDVIVERTPFGHENIRVGFYFILVAPCTISSGVVMVSEIV